MKLTCALLIFAMLSLASCSHANPISVQPHQSFGPATVNIGTDSGDFKISSLKLNDRVRLYFTVAGAPVAYSVQDPGGKTILIGRGAFHFLQRGRGHFTASSSGDYKVHFESSGLGNPSVITIRYTVYSAQ